MVIAAGRSTPAHFHLFPYSRALEGFHSSYMSAANWMSVYKWPLYDKRFITPIKSLHLSTPESTLEALSSVTACCSCCASSAVGNYPSVFLCFPTNSWAAQDVQRKWGIWICLLICTSEHLCTYTVVICSVSRAHNRSTQFQHTQSYYTAYTV